jgi:hypothetical protein
VTVGEDKSVSVDPLGVGRAELHEPRPENVGSGSHTLLLLARFPESIAAYITYHGCTGVTRVGLHTLAYNQTS